jgi:hypothetical protein
MNSRSHRVITASLTSGAALLAGLAWTAPAAHAATVTVTLQCDAPVTLVADPGDTIVLTMGAGCSADWELFNANGTWTPETFTEAGYLDFVSATPSGDFHPYYRYDNDWFQWQSDTLDRVVTTTLLPTDGAGAPLAPGVTVAEVDDDGTSSYPILFGGTRSPHGTPPPSWYQSYGRATADMACEAGWGPSWAMWANGGTGGYVCDRELYFDTASGEWRYR